MRSYGQRRASRDPRHHAQSFLPRKTLSSRRDRMDSRSTSRRNTARDSGTRVFRPPWKRFNSSKRSGRHLLGDKACRCRAGLSRCHRSIDRKRAQTNNPHLSFGDRSRAGHLPLPRSPHSQLLKQRDATAQGVWREKSRLAQRFARPLRGAHRRLMHRVVFLSEDLRRRRQAGALRACHSLRKCGGARASSPGPHPAARPRRGGPRWDSLDHRSFRKEIDFKHPKDTLKRARRQQVRGPTTTPS